MSLALLRSSAANRLTVTALSSLLHHPHSLSTAPPLYPNGRIHSPAPIGRPVDGLVRGFGASASWMKAEFSAMVDFAEEDRAMAKGGGDEGLEIAKLGISEHIVKALAKKGITKLFPIQKAVLEPAMQGRDMIGRARTGTGKTLAFGIPIMDKIIRLNEEHGCSRDPLALVLAPTRELARQVDKEFYESAPNLDTLCVYGGVPISQQMYRLNHGMDVVVGTPGRVIDLLKRGSLNLSQVQFLVLDEADQMLNVGFAEDVETILQHVPLKRQTMMFSATMPSWIKKLTMQYLKNPLTIDLVGESDQKLADGISLYSIASEMYEKPSIIGTLITEHAKGGKCIVFTQTKRDADKLSYAMGRNFKCQALHGDISQSQRERTLSGFREGHFNVLVATDVAARGLDVPNVDVVIHYELPTTSEVFVHRSGRTGRAGKKGSAILIYSSSQMRDVKTIERDVGCKFKELTPIKVEGGSNMFNDMGGFSSHRGGGGSRFSDPGFSRSNGFGRSSGYGGQQSFGRSSGFSGNSSRFGNNDSSFSRSSGYGSGRSGSFRGNEFGRTGGFGDRGGSGSFGGSEFGQTGGFGDRGGSGSFGGSEFGRTGGFGDRGGSDRRSDFGGFGSRSTGGFGDFRLSKPSGGFNDSRSSRFDDLFGDAKVGGDKNLGRRPF